MEGGGRGSEDQRAVGYIAGPWPSALESLLAGILAGNIVRWRADLTESKHFCEAPSMFCVEFHPRLVTDFGDAVGVGEFYRNIYNMTPAHMEDIHKAIIENPDLEVITELGGERRRANTIKPLDTLRMKHQRSFFPIFLGGDQSWRKK